MKKILIVDDEQTILDLYSRALVAEFEVLTAANGVDGLEIIEKEKPDLVLVDVKMPEMDGLAMIAEMKDRGLLKTPVIILTNFAHDEKIAQAIEMGAKEYLLKDRVTPSEIRTKIKNLLD